MINIDKLQINEIANIHKDIIELKILVIILMIFKK